MEAHDFRMFDSPTEGSVRVSMKTEQPKRFWVDHLSIYESFLRNKRRSPPEEIDRIMKSKGAKHISGRCQEAKDVRASMSSEFLSGGDDRSMIALVPYFGGHLTKKSKGNAHSNVSRTSKFRQFHGTICSIAAGLPMTRVVVGVCHERDRLDIEDVFRSEGNRDDDNAPPWLLWKIIEFKCEHGVFLAPYLLRHFQERYRQGDWKARFVYFTEQDQLLRVDPSLGTRGIMSAVGRNSYVSPNRYENGRLKNNCENGIRVVTSSRAHALLNELPRCASPRDDATTAKASTAVSFATGFERYMSADSSATKAYLVDAASFQDLNLHRMRKSAPKLQGAAEVDFVSSLHAADPVRLLLKTVAAHDFYAVDLSSEGAGDEIFDHKGLGNNSRWWEETGAPFSCAANAPDSSAQSAARRLEEVQLDGKSWFDQLKLLKAAEQKYRAAQPAVSTSSRFDGAVGQPAQISSPEAKPRPREESDHHLAFKQGGASPVARHERRGHVLVLMALRSFEFDDPRHSATGLCSALRLFKHVAVGYCSTPATSGANGRPINRGDKVPGFEWLADSGIARHLFDAAAVDCSSGPPSIGAAMLHYYQSNFRRNPGEAKASKSSRAKTSLYPSFRFVLYTTSAAVALRIAPSSFPRLASALSSRTVLAAHTYAPRKENGNSDGSSGEEASPSASRRSWNRIPLPLGSWTGSGPSAGAKNLQRDWSFPLTIDEAGSTHVPDASQPPRQFTGKDGKKGFHRSLLLVTRVSNEGRVAAWGASEAPGGGSGPWCL